MSRIRILNWQLWVAVLALLIVAIVAYSRRNIGVQLAPVRRGLNGSLRVDPANPRYFTDNSGQAIYLTGSHTWTNLIDSGFTDPPPRFDYPAYLDFLLAHNLNFFRLWAWEQTRQSPDSDTVPRGMEHIVFGMNPFARTGPGTANDGLPKFDVTRFDEDYFRRMREGVQAAGARGMYVSVMLFNGFSIEKKGGVKANPWRFHPFNAANNVNGMDGDMDHDGEGRETHTLAVPAVTRVQEAYVRKVIDTVGDLDNVLYEISNESRPESRDWQYHMIRFIKAYEATKSKQHPVGMTVEYPDGKNSDVLASPADWVSLNGDLEKPTVADGTKVILDDTDHLCGVCGSVSWVWKSFLSGRNPILMDPYNSDKVLGPLRGINVHDRKWEDIRKNLGYTLTYANRVNLTSMVPHPDLSSTSYCLANPTGDSASYLVFVPVGKSASVDVGAAGVFSVEWLNTATGRVIAGGTVNGGGTRTLKPPFRSDSVLFLHR